MNRRGMQDFSWIWHGEKKVIGKVYKHNYSSGLLLKTPLPARDFQDFGYIPVSRLCRQLIYDEKAVRDLQITPKKVTSHFYYNNECGHGQKQIRKLMLKVPCMAREWNILLHMTRRQVNFKRITNQQEEERFAQECVRCGSALDACDRNMVFHILLECPYFCYEQQAAWHEATNLLRSNDAIPAIADLRDQNKKLVDLIREKRNAVIRLAQSAIDFDRMTQTHREKVYSLIYQPTSPHSEFFIKSLAWNTTIEEIANHRGHVGENKWLDKKTKYEQQLGIGHQWVAMEEYITLYRAQRQLDDNNAILDLLYTKGENIATCIIKHGNWPDADACLLNPQKGMYYNTFVLVLTAFIIKHVVTPTLWK